MSNVIFLEEAFLQRHTHGQEVSEKCATPCTSKTHAEPTKNCHIWVAAINKIKGKCQQGGGAVGSLTLGSQESKMSWLLGCRTKIPQKIQEVIYDSTITLLGVYW